MSMEMGWCWLILRGCGMFHMRSHPAEVNGSCLSPNQPFSQSAIMVRYDHGVASHVSESPSPEMLLQTLEPTLSSTHSRKTLLSLPSLLFEERSRT